MKPCIIDALLGIFGVVQDVFSNRETVRTIFIGGFRYSVCVFCQYSSIICLSSNTIPPLRSLKVPSPYKTRNALKPYKIFRKILVLDLKPIVSGADDEGKSTHGQTTMAARTYPRRHCALCVYEFLIHNLHCVCPDIVHLTNPHHLVGNFQRLGDTLGLGHLFNDGI